MMIMVNGWSLLSSAFSRSILLLPFYITGTLKVLLKDLWRFIYDLKACLPLFKIKIEML